MSESITELCWPTARLPEAVEALVRRSGLAIPDGSALRAAGPLGGAEEVGRWIDAAADSLGLEAEPAPCRYAQLPDLLRNAAPAVLRFVAGGEAHILVVLGCRRSTVSVLGQDHEVHQKSLREVCAAICREVEDEQEAVIGPLLSRAGLTGRNAAKVRQALLHDRLGMNRLGDCWLLRTPPGGTPWNWLRQTRFFERVLSLAAAYAVAYAVWIFSWWVIGGTALAGRVDRGWLLAWALLLATLIPVRVLTTWLQGLLAIGIGGKLKQRLLFGALRLDPDKIRCQGVGQLLGRVFEAEILETLAVGGGILGAASLIELAAAAWVLSVGAGGGLQAGCLMLWTAVALILCWRYFRKYGHWTSHRFGMTNDLVEQLTGHRTRIAQQPREDWHQAEDRVLDGYFAASVDTDRSGGLLLALIPRGWLLIGVATLASHFDSATGASTGLAVALGGVLLAYRALRSLSRGLWQLVGARTAWNQVGPIFHSASQPAERTHPAVATTRPASAGESGERGPLVEANNVVFQFPGRPEPVLSGCNLRIVAGDRLLIEGVSGGGKSTLASLLAGLRSPGSGLLLVSGLDRETLGSAGWRRRITAAPQFHENHVLTGTFAFNLLMGRRWPPWPTDMAEAETLCRELGLGELLDRMPAGLQQTVGETGWQLSHGERNRLFIARTLLQGADLIILDESFAALDPENLRRAMNCVLKRAPAVMVIAHP